MICLGSEPFCDWLDVTYAPGDSVGPDHPVEHVRTFLDGLLCPVLFADNTAVRIRVGLGVVSVEYGRKCWRVSASGSALHYLRSVRQFDSYLSLLSGRPHRVTRLDAAVDLRIDAPEILRSLESRYPDDRVNLQRKALKVTRMYSARESDGKLTGTWYAGHRSQARVTARVYDKQAEALAKRGETLPPTTRVELTFRKDHGCTLRDAAMPYSLFYQYASPALVDRPEGFTEWVSNGEGWATSPEAPALPYELFRRRVETSPELARLVELADRFGPEGRSLLLRTLESRIIARSSGDSSAEV